ncbi:MAG: GldG family protein [Lachnospiraceae bacterium]|jgi:ABC-2 type transport system permease protein|nr:GldG family protein [Lachnospiraceae bacterium]MCI1727450.1 GldG family protein [Lachnospiraceae bacterium]
MSLFDEKNIIHTDGDIIEDAAKELNADGVEITNGLKEKTSEAEKTPEDKAEDAAEQTEKVTESAAEQTEKAAETAAENDAETAAGAADAAAETASAETEKPESKTEEKSETPEKKVKKKKAKKPGEPVDKKSLKNGSYFLTITVVAIAAIIIINMIVGAIPSTFTKIDITDNKLYSIGNVTKGVLSGLDQDIDIYYLAQSGKENDTIKRLLDSYSAASSHIKVEEKDLNTNPTFAKQYTDETVQDNSIIVVCGDKSRYISNDEINDTDSSSYSYSSSQSFDGEGQITSAIAYVTNSTETTMYVTSGHNEISLDDSITKLLTKANVTTSDLNLLSTDIPDDCKTLMIFAPSSDFTAEEAQKVITYLQNGGHAMIVSVASTTEMPNFDSILAAFGISRIDGYVIDNDSAHYTQAPVLLMPDKVSSSVVYDGLSDLNLVYAFAQGIKTADDTGSYTVSPILQSSSDSYSISLDTTTGTKEDGDPQGPFDLAVSVTGGDNNTKLLYYTTPCAFSSTALSSLLNANVSMPEGDTKLLSNSITYLTDTETNVTVDAKSTAVTYNTVSETIGTATRAIFMYVLPACVLILGFVFWFRRRSR